MDKAMWCVRDMGVVDMGVAWKQLHQEGHTYWDRDGMF